MDITPDQKPKKKEPEPTSAKPSPANPTFEDLAEDEYLLDGKVYRTAPDLKDLPEFDWDAPENQEFIKAEEHRMRAKFGHMTQADMNRMIEIRDKVLAEHPGMSGEAATDLVMEKYFPKP